MATGPYVVTPNPKGGWDVTRMKPTVIASGLKRAEADTLAYELNAQIRLLENAK